VGSLEAYCARGDDYCPATYAEARAKLREKVAVLIPRLILQQGCVAPDGSARLRVSAAYGSMSMSYIFEPSNEQLVGVQIFDDLGGCAGSRVEESNPAFGQTNGFYGEDLPGCSFNYSDVEVPPECRVPEDWNHLDAGTPRYLVNDAGEDAGALEAGAPYECIVAP
jgi:hypothetical protein